MRAAGERLFEGAGAVGVLARVPLGSRAVRRVSLPQAVVRTWLVSKCELSRFWQNNDALPIWQLIPLERRQCNPHTSPSQEF